MNLWHASYELRPTVGTLTAATKLRGGAGRGLGLELTDSSG
jgi:hypothetical protein